MIKVKAINKGALRPMPKVLVSCRGLNGEEDALAVAYCGNCSYDPPMIMVGIVPSRYSYHLIKESGCFVVNIPEKNYQDEFDYLGSVSKRNCDKLKDKHIKTEDAVVINAPILSDCRVNIECTVVNSVLTGSHEMFIGKIEYVHSDKNITDKDGTIDFSTMQLL